MELDITYAYGMFGCPMLNAKGEVVGICWENYHGARTF